MTDIVKAVGEQGLGFLILVGVILALHQGLIITKSHFDDYRRSRDALDDELRRELREKNEENALWQQMARSGPPTTNRVIEMARDLLREIGEDQKP